MPVSQEPAARRAAARCSQGLTSRPKPDLPTADLEPTDCPELVHSSQRCSSCHRCKWLFMPPSTDSTNSWPHAHERMAVKGPPGSVARLSVTPLSLWQPQAQHPSAEAVLKWQHLPSGTQYAAAAAAVCRRLRCLACRCAPLAAPAMALCLAVLRRSAARRSRTLCWLSSSPGTSAACSLSCRMDAAAETAGA